MEKLTVSLQYSPRYVGRGLPYRELNSIQEEFKDGLNLVIVPSHSETQNLDCAYHHDIISIVLTLGGLLGTFSVVKSFLSAFATEAGKDSYKSLKTLITKLCRKSVDSSYQVRINCFVLIPVCGDFVALELSPDQMLTSGDISDSAIESMLTERATELSQYIKDKQVLLKAYLGGDNSGCITVFSKQGDKFVHRTMTYTEFLDQYIYPFNLKMQVSTFENYP